ncbi:hypothetical protein A2753_00050 [Candidatus Uhrbacteria bacterium RIFCSPHIGHO2_01_FULL_47_11]|nr:MAG: hypothetical protein A2753_00050 [Candidatus Uhrbacteria bacterium RIFCSPHIGHO2_01_FULL_47_11]
MLHKDNMHHAMEKFFVSSVTTERPQLTLQSSKTLARLFWSREATTKFKQLLELSNVDIAHCHNIYHQISPSILSLLKSKKVPVVMTLHDFHLVSPAYNLYAHGGSCTHSKGSKFFNAVTHRCVKNSYAASMLCACELWLHRKIKVYENNIDCFLAPSRFMAHTIQEWGFHPRRIEVIPNFVEPKTPQPFPAQPSVLFAGRISSEKGIEVLFKVIALLPDVRFTIAGTGPMVNEVKQFAETHKNLTLLGHVAPEKMGSIFDQCSLLIVPSLAPEVFPMIILEAFAHGRPVIASRTGGIPELVTPGETGEMIEAGDAEAFTKTITTLLSNQSNLERMGNRALILVQKKYSPEMHYQQIIKIYQSVR